MKADRGNFTKEMVQRLRLRRGLSNPIESKGDEYGNYEKFEDGRNKVEQVNDPGHDDCGVDQFQSNVNQMFRFMSHPDADKNQKHKEDLEKTNIENTVKSELVDDINLGDIFSENVKL